MGHLGSKCPCKLSTSATGPSQAVLTTNVLTAAHLLFQRGSLVRHGLRRGTGAVLRWDWGCIAGCGGAARGARSSKSGAVPCHRAWVPVGAGPRLDALCLPSEALGVWVLAMVSPSPLSLGLSRDCEGGRYQARWGVRLAVPAWWRKHAVI